MARQYSLRGFLKQAPKDLLRRYLNDKGFGEQTKFMFGNTDLLEQDTGALITLLREEARAAKDARRKEIRGIYRDFSRINTLGDRHGYDVMLEFSANPDRVRETFATLRSDLHRAFWYFFEEPAAFETAALFHHSDTAGGWKKRRSDLHGLLPVLTDDAKYALQGELAEHFKQSESRGESCEIIQESRADGRHYWFASLADTWQTVENVDEEGRHDLLMIRPTFEVVFVYNPRDYTLAIRGLRKRQHITAMQQAFGRAQLKRDLPEDKVEDVYNLNRLVEPLMAGADEFPFTTDVNDHVRSMRVKSIRYKVRQSVFPRVTLESHGMPTRRLFDDLRRHLVSDDADWGDIDIDYATFEVIFDDQTPVYKGPRSFYISGKRTCDLKFDERDLVLHGLLKKWGIDVSEDVDDDPDGGRATDLQCVF